jgi:class 3 adenylate cyclase/pimeloyl-ACP methyl ester carboxylesterase
MASERAQKRLSAVLAADVVGYSRLIGEDEAGTISALQALHRDLIVPTVDAHGGRIVKRMGDGYLIEFKSSSDAINSAVAWQSGIIAQEQAGQVGPDIQFRIGINLGDIVSHDDDIYGDGVNVAARLESLAPAGGICVSASVRDAVGSNTVIQFEDLGPQRFKNITRPVRAYLVSRGASPGGRSPGRVGLADQSAVRYCMSPDGASIAHAQVGDGYPLIVGGSWMTHLELDWENPGWGHHIRDLAKVYTVIRYDQRGNGMSDWHGIELSFERMVDDLESVIDCYEFDKVAIFGPSQAASVSIAYTRRCPEKVSHLILYGGYARGRRRRGSPQAMAESEALVTLIRQGWGADNPAFRQTMTSLFMPDASQDEANWFNEFQKTCGPGENIARFREMFDEIDVSHLLDEVQVPTLVLHCRADSVAPISEGKFLASRISGAKFVMLNSNAHMLFDNDPEYPKLVRCIREFISDK